jgi:signal transduction histidine kinase
MHGVHRFAGIVASQRRGFRLRAFLYPDYRGDDCGEREKHAVDFFLVGGLALMAGVLMALQYYLPQVVVVASTRRVVFADNFIGATAALVVITCLYVIILNYYRREHRRATEYQVRLEKQENALELARLDRLNLIGEMAAGIGHEVRNPLTTIRGFLQLFRNKQEYEAHREHFDMMIGEIDRANAIIRSFTPGEE